MNVIRTLDDCIRLAQILAVSDFVAPEYREKPANVMAVIMWGAEMGLGPVQALNAVKGIKLRRQDTESDDRRSGAADSPRPATRMEAVKSKLNRIRLLQNQEKTEPPEDKSEALTPGTPTVEEVIGIIRSARNERELRMAADLAAELSDETEKKIARAVYAERKQVLSGQPVALAS
ncbi:hypothetical protein SAMN02746041_03167 [Desulfacinum hydrothermale DSM 13146]|uniref:Uncharacterized protein n=1 Tax=Desulfacinum hydrothermale DSM 13146 TaxID=1121390 RepID=A0A1W1XW32_9BACT|nr:hypothetical protein [Desulfacinum hydrothermale]SMC28065.1 hypothetical protein SAMN02746041_03167 [Desulfacinum hydrothermale DSM 13146]